MDERTNIIIDRAEELFNDTVSGDLDIVRDRLSFITWLTALATAAILFSMSQSGFTQAVESPKIQSIDLKLWSMALMFTSVVLGILAKYQGHQTMRYYRLLLAMAKTQRLPFYRKAVEEDPITFSRKYHNCEFLKQEYQEQFKKLNRLTTRWYSEESLLYLQAIAFVLGYAGVASIVLELWKYI